MRYSKLKVYPSVAKNITSVLLHRMERLVRLIDPRHMTLHSWRQQCAIPALQKVLELQDCCWNDQCG